MFSKISQMISGAFLLFCLFSWSGGSAGYYTVFLEDFCTESETFTFTVGAASANSSGILSSTRSRTFLDHRNCLVYVHPPFGYGVVLTMRYLDMRPFRDGKCENYVLLIGEEQNGEFYLCGYSDDVAEYKSYHTTGPMKILFHTESPKVEAHSDISLVVTSFVKRKDECPLRMFQCQNDRCIWEGLTCDHHNNCGDRSDESTFSRSHCGGYWSIVGISIGVVIAVSVFVVFPIVLWYRRRSRWREESTEEEERRRLLSGSSSVRNEMRNGNIQFQGEDAAEPHDINSGSGNSSSSSRPQNDTPPPSYEDSMRQ